MDINRKCFQYYLSPIKDTTSKTDMFTMIIHGYQKLAKSELNVAALEKAMGKEVDNSWYVPLTIDSVHHINNA